MNFFCLLNRYQKFEYAIGHWLQKATEHMIGCVLCSPGCFSLFRYELKSFKKCKSLEEINNFLNSFIFPFELNYIYLSYFLLQEIEY
jgi:hypothetical protein